MPRLDRNQFRLARYHGWDLADVILDLGYVRLDGRTLIGQSALDLEGVPVDHAVHDHRRMGAQGFHQDLGPHPLQGRTGT
jgi:hypothetical protein